MDVATPVGSGRIEPEGGERVEMGGGRLAVEVESDATCLPPDMPSIMAARSFETGAA